MAVRVEVGAFRRIVRSQAADAVRGARSFQASPRRGVTAYEAVALPLADALAGLNRWTVPALPSEAARLIRAAVEACAAESGDAVWLVLHADGSFEALAPRAYLAFAGAHPIETFAVASFAGRPGRSPCYAG